MGSKAGAAPLRRDLDTKDPKRDSEPGKQGRIQGEFSNFTSNYPNKQSYRYKELFTPLIFGQMA